MEPQKNCASARGRWSEGVSRSFSCNKSHKLTSCLCQIKFTTQLPDAALLGHLVGHHKPDQFLGKRHVSCTGARVFVRPEPRCLEAAYQNPRAAVERKPDMQNVCRK